VKANNFSFISIEPKNGNFVASMSMEGFIDNEVDPEVLTRNAINIYEKYIKRMRNFIGGIQDDRKKRKPIFARKIWQLGNAIFKMTEELENLSLYLDNLYYHLTRDLGVKRKWLEKVVIFRRYILEVSLIPKSLNWGRCEKGTRNIAEKISKGSI